jgi:2-amino-4-hydroxy-6-hydroxymethyldihydropteridine diphosphokinase
MLHQIYISVGSNIDKERNTRSGLNAMQKVFGSIRLSTVYESEAVGFSGSHFYNLVVEAQTDDDVASVCRALKVIEQQNGRVRGEKKFAPRTLDLDLLLFDDLITQDGVVLPRDEIEYNAFVLLPLSELAPNLSHPTTLKTYQKMWQEYDQSKQKLWPVEFTWSPA